MAPISIERKPDDVSVRAADRGADPRWPIELATFISGEFCESIFVTRARAAGILLETADALGIDLMAVLRGVENATDEFDAVRADVRKVIEVLAEAECEACRGTGLVTLTDVMVGGLPGDADNQPCPECRA